MIYLQTNLTGECYGEDIVSFAEVVIPRIVLVHRILGSDGNTEGQWEWREVICREKSNDLPGEADDDHDEFVEGRSAHKPVDQLPHTETTLIRSIFRELYLKYLNIFYREINRK